MSKPRITCPNCKGDKTVRFRSNGILRECPCCKGVGSITKAKNDGLPKTFGEMRNKILTGWRPQ